MSRGDAVYLNGGGGFGAVLAVNDRRAVALVMFQSGGCGEVPLQLAEFGVRALSAYEATRN